MPDCIFCKIAKGEIGTEFVYEDAYVVAFKDINPVAEGHTLVIPKEHSQWFYEVPDETANAWFKAAQSLASELKSTYHPDFIELSIVGTDVPHAHIHLIPRKRSN